MNKKIFLIILQIIVGYSCFATKQPVIQGTATDKVAAQPTLFKAENKKKKYSKLKSLLLCHNADSLMFNLAKIVSEDLDFTDQFDVELAKSKQELANVTVKKLFSQGTSLLIFFDTFEKPKVSKSSKSKKRRKHEKRAKEIENNSTTIKVTVKDTSSDLTVFDKTISFNKKELVTHAHTLSSEVLLALTGDKGVCLSSLAYCKQLSSSHKVICVSDYACKQSRVVVKRKTINLAPRWHSKSPVLYYSQLTKSNNRLMSINMRTKRHKVECSYPGLNMQPTFSPDGEKTIVCLSGGQGNSELYLHDKALSRRVGRTVFKPVTDNGEHNVSPSILPDGNIVFCSNYHGRQPQLCYLNMETKEITRLTSGRGYAAAPSYCAKTNMVVYVRPVRGYFQLFVLSMDDLDSVVEKQITFGQGNKHEPCWSHDGRYIAFSIDFPHNKKRQVSQIAAMNYQSGKMRILTRDPAPKSFPRWTGAMVWG